MELQQQTREPIITIVQSSSSKKSDKPNKTLKTTKQQQIQEKKQIQSLVYDNLEKLAEQLKELQEKVEQLKENFEIHESATDKELIDLGNQYTKTARQQETLNSTIIKLSSKFTKLKETNNQFSSLESSLSSSEKTIIKNESHENEKLSIIKKDQKEYQDLLMLHMGSYGDTAYEVGQHAESLKSLEASLVTVKKDITDLSQLSSEIMNTTNKAATVTQQTILLLGEKVLELQNNQLSANKSLETVSAIQKKLSLLKEQLEKQQPLFEAINKKNTSLENIITQQTQSISTLRKWLMAFGGGSVIALTIWLWHYTHK